MTTIALISDIHGNLPALEAVLKDIRRQSPDRIWVLGDVAVAGPHPKEVLDRIVSLEIPVVRGNTDEDAGSPPSHWQPPDPQSAELYQRLLHWAQDRLSAKERDYLKQLPLTVELELTGMSTALGFHATPQSTRPFIFADATDDVLASLCSDTSGRERSQVVFAAYGHIHRPFVRILPGGRWVVNPGSVGIPSPGEPWASYAMARIERDRVEAHLLRIPYDGDAVVRAARARDLPNAQIFAAAFKS